MACRRGYAVPRRMRSVPTITRLRRAWIARVLSLHVFRDNEDGLCDTKSGGKGSPLRAVITGGAGFLGSHLCDYFIEKGWDVLCMDNLVTGADSNISHLLSNPRFSFAQQDVSKFIEVSGPVDAVLHFASPASPPDYLKFPIQTLKVGALGTHNALGLAMAKKARFLQASTSECYGDPEVSPQPETYWGNVNPIGPRGVYDEAKRFAEAITMAYHRHHQLDVRIVRIFNSILADEQILYDDGRELRRETAADLAARLGGEIDLSG